MAYSVCDPLKQTHHEPIRALHAKSRAKQVAVIGGCGFIGSHVCRGLISCGYAVVVFARRGGSRILIEEIEDRLQICEGDINCTDDVLSAIADVEILVHLAHTTTPAASMADPVHDVTSNLAPLLKWLGRLAETKVRRILYFSSGGTV
jgi:UDP-glucose 4-epimerase